MSEHEIRELLRDARDGHLSRRDFARIMTGLGLTDPWTEVDGERSSVKTVHPFLTDPAIRDALALLVDRTGIQEQILGRTGQVTANFISAPERYRSKNTRWEFNVDKANQILDAGGWTRGADGIRGRDGKRLKMVFQTATNSAAQKIQAVIKQAAAKAGIGRSRRKRTTGRSSTSGAGATRNTIGSSRPPRPRSIRSSARRCSSA